LFGVFRKKCVPTAITHAIIPLALGKAATRKKETIQFWLLAVVCSVVPDLDVIGFSFGVEYGDFFGHRGFFHSLFFAFLLSLFVVVVAFRKERILSRRWLLIWLFFFVVSGSHGVLDMLTDGGLGIAIFSPFDTARYFFPWRPLRVSPIGIDAFFTYWGGRSLQSEIIWIWIPLMVVLIASEVCRRLRPKARSNKV
jgi:inner membrane protein